MRDLLNVGHGLVADLLLDALVGVFDNEAYLALIAVQRMRQRTSGISE